MSIFATFLERYKHYELLTDKLYFSVSESPIESKQKEVAFSILDYPKEFSLKKSSPPSIRQIYSFFNIVECFIESGKSVHFYTTSSNLAHSIVFLCCFMIMKTRQGADLVFAPFSLLSAMIHPFRFVDSNQKTFDLTVVTCLRSFERALKLNFFSIETFNPEQYDYFDALSMHWVVPDFLLAFSSMPSQVLSLKKVLLAFNKLHLNHYISLCGTLYDKQTFLDYGFDITEYDATEKVIPPPKIVKGFLDISGNSDHTFVVHSHGEIDLSGLLSACLIVRKFNFSPDEAIAWVKMCKPGSISNSQQFYVVDFENQIKNTITSVEIVPPDANAPRRLAPRCRIRSALAPVSSAQIPIQVRSPQSMSVRKFEPPPINEPPFNNSATNLSPKPICPSGPCKRTRVAPPPRKMVHFMASVPAATLA